MNAETPDDALSFSVLGPMTVHRGGEPVDLGTPKARAVLAVLLTRWDQYVSVGALVDALWGVSPPKTAVKSIQVYIHQLRRALGSAERIVRQSPGYRLVVRPGELDAQRFEELTRHAWSAEDPGDLLQEALDLWQGDEPYAGVVDVPPVQTESYRLTEVRVAALHDRVDADLRLGRHTRLPAELATLTSRYPLRERLWAQLMIALDRCGRSADALRAYDRARRVIAEETGLDPGPELRDLQRMILTRSGTPVTSGPGSEARPWMLPGDIGDFTGRTAELAPPAGRFVSGADRTARHASSR